MLLLSLAAVIVTLAFNSLYDRFDKVSKEEAERFTKRETNYFKSLKLIDCDEMLEEEKAFRRMDFKMLDDSALEKIEAQKEA